MNIEKFAADASRVHTLPELRAAMNRAPDQRCMASWGFSVEQDLEALTVAISTALAVGSAA